MKGLQQQIKTLTIMSISTTIIVIIVAVLHFSSTNNESATDYAVLDSGGVLVKTWAAWHLDKDEPLHVRIINSTLESSNQYSAINDAIMSEDHLTYENPTQAVYYVGWNDALGSVKGLKTKYAIPQISLSKTDNEVGDVIIRLTDTKDPKYSGFTKSIIDTKNHQILKSIITIYDVKDLTDTQIEAVVRHEMGHALGLGDAEGENDLMNHVIDLKYSYITQCDVQSIIILYNDTDSQKVHCAK